jgi:hypothetical protein
VWAGDKGDEGSLLWKLWNYQRTLESMPAKLASKMLQSEQVDRVPYSYAQKRQRSEVEEKEGGNQISKCQKR